MHTKRTTDNMIARRPTGRRQWVQYENWSAEVHCLISYRWSGVAMLLNILYADAVLPARHRDAEGLIFYRCGCFFLSFFLLFFDAQSLMSLNGSQPNLDTYSLMTAIWKIWSQLSRAFTPPPRAYTDWEETLFGTDFELWPNLSLQRKLIWTIRENLLIYRDFPTCPQSWWTLVQKRLASFCLPHKFLYWETLSALPNGRYI